jgi:glutamine amidotransferase PdxT
VSDGATGAHPADLDGLDAIVLPGGESTTMSGC